MVFSEALTRPQFAGLATAIGGLIVVVFNPKKLSTLGVVLSFASGGAIFISEAVISFLTRDAQA